MREGEEGRDREGEREEGARERKYVFECVFLNNHMLSTRSETLSSGVI